MTDTGIYQALALQVGCAAVNRCQDRAGTRQRMLETITRLRAQIRASKAFIGPHLRLVVLPEYFLTGFPMGESIAAWADKAALEMTGPEYEALSALSADNGIYLSGNAYELDDHFPGLYFQTSFIIAPNGNVELRYRRLISMFAPTPHDVLDRYLDIYGLDGLFPVLDTPLGRLAAVASEEILYPELTRAFALRGAELICHSSSEVGSPLPTPKNIAKQARAYENHVYVVSANSAGINDIDIPAASTDGGSKVVDFHGQVLAEASPGESMVANAEIDIGALRHYRRRPGMGNLLSRQRLELFTGLYAGSVYPANTLLNADGAIRIPDRQHFLQTQAGTIAALLERGIIR